MRATDRATDLSVPQGYQRSPSRLASGPPGISRREIKSDPGVQLSVEGLAPHTHTRRGSGHLDGPEVGGGSRSRLCQSTPSARLSSASALREPFLPNGGLRPQGGGVVRMFHARRDRIIGSWVVGAFLSWPSLGSYSAASPRRQPAMRVLPARSPVECSRSPVTAISITTQPSVRLLSRASRWATSPRRLLAVCTSPTST